MPDADASKVRKILIVDDTPEDRVVCKRYLLQDRDWHYQFLEAESGRRALELQAEGKPDCILLDYALPDQSGLEVLAELANKLGDGCCPVVMLTGANEVELAVAALKGGAQDFINKDRLAPMDLQRAVHNAIDRVSLRCDLLESEEMFRATFDQAAIGIAHIDPQGNVLRVNRALCQLLGYSRDELIKVTFADLTSPEDLAIEAESKEQLLRGEIPSYSMEARCVRKDGSTFWVNLTASCVHDRDGTVKYVVKIVENITARKDIEIEREHLIKREQEARKTAESHNRAKDDFLSVVTHELRSPLHAILGYTRLTKSCANNPSQVRQYCDIIQRSAQTQQGLIDDLLDTARIISGKLRIEVSPCDLRLVLAEALSVVQPAAGAKDIKLNARIGSDAQMVIGDPSRLQQVFWNLLQNAIKFTPPKGSVDLTIKVVDDFVDVIIADTGKGIEPEFLPAIFDRFSQNDMSRTRRYGGLGLGLALVKQLIELHGGEIEADSRGEGQGAVFTVRLPLQISSSEGHAINNGSTPVTIQMTDDEPSRSAQLLLANISVLAVDDQEESRQLIEDVLKSQGARITTVGSGPEALALLSDDGNRKRPDVIVLDIAMPDEDGYSVLRKIRSFENHHGLSAIPAIALTSYISPKDRLAALSAGFQMHVGKPVDMEELVVAICGLVNGAPRDAHAREDET